MNPINYPSFLNISLPTSTGWEFKPTAALQEVDLENFTKNFKADFNKLIDEREKITNLPGVESQCRTMRKISCLVQSLLKHSALATNPQSSLVLGMNIVAEQIKCEDELLQELLFAKVQSYFTRNQVNAVADGHNTLLHMAALKGDIQAIRMLLAAGYPIDSRDDQGNTAFMSVCSGHGLDVAEVLASAGANVNAQNQDGETALSRQLSSLPYALTPEAQKEAYNTIALLLKLKASCTIPDARNISPLEYAFSHDMPPGMILDMLATQKAPLNIPNKRFIPLMDALEARKKGESRNWDLVICRLLDLGVNPNRGKCGVLPINLAKDLGARGVFMKLIEKGAHLNSSLFFGNGPNFFSTSIVDNAEIEQFLCRQLPCSDVDPEHQIWNLDILRIRGLLERSNFDQFGVMPTNLEKDLPAKEVFIKYIKIRLCEQARARLLLRPDFFNTCQSLFVGNNHAFLNTCIQGLRARGTGFTNIDGRQNSLLHYAVEMNDPAAVMQILEQDFATPDFVNHQNENGHTALSLSVSLYPQTIHKGQTYEQERQREAIIDMLIQSKPGLDTTDKENNTLLHHASKFFSTGLLNAILEQKFATAEYVNRKNSAGQTAICYAASFLLSSDCACDHLIEHGARLDIVDNEGNTLFHHVAIGGNRYLLKILLAQPFANADFLNRRNAQGQTALQIARANSRKWITYDNDAKLKDFSQLLICHGAQENMLTELDEKKSNEPVHHEKKGRKLDDMESEERVPLGPNTVEQPNISLTSRLQDLNIEPKKKLKLA
jgi:ankyrin repeat protein